MPVSYTHLADDKGLTGRAAEEFQRTNPGHAEAHHADDDGRRHGDDHPDGGDAAAENQLLLVLDGHEAEQDVGPVSYTHLIILAQRTRFVNRHFQFFSKNFEKIRTADALCPSRPPEGRSGKGPRCV